MRLNRRERERLLDADIARAAAQGFTQSAKNVLCAAVSASAIWLAPIGRDELVLFPLEARHVQAVSGKNLSTTSRLRFISAARYTSATPALPSGVIISQILNRVPSPLSYFHALIHLRRCLSK